ncbi:DUF6220 domain-containing protein [Rhizobium sp. RCAM05350]|nr:DUF6220 domain-containing protein [Rhizobium sp. RCAM05350]
MSASVSPSSALPVPLYFRALAVSVPTLIGGQLFLAGLAIFSDGLAWQWHGALGGGIGLVILLLLGVVVFTPGLKGHRSPAVVLFVLYCFQFVWLELGAALAIGWVQALHPANAMALATFSVLMARRAVA